MIKPPEELRLYVIKPPEELRLYLISPPKELSQRPQQDTRLSLGQGAGVIEDSSFVEEPIIESPVKAVSDIVIEEVDEAVEEVEEPVIELPVKAVPDKRAGGDKGRSRSKNRSKSRSQRPF